MNDLEKLHNKAMELAEEASLEKFKGNFERASKLFKRALAKEKAASAQVKSKLKMEPTRSVLYRSAASLALECKSNREAEKLIATALSGNPPREIASELRILLEQVYLQRHMDLRGIELAPHEFQVSISGNAVGFGLVRSEVFLTRVKYLEKLIFRTAERKSKLPFRERGRRISKITKDLEMFLSVPRAASYSISFRLGQQPALPGFGRAEIVIDELLDCLELFGTSKMQNLHFRIPDPSYYRNFYQLAKRFSPDGDDVRSVGLTVSRQGRERRLALNVPQSELPSFPEDLIEEKKGEKIRIEGTLLYADATKKKKNIIKIIDDKNKSYNVIVPTGMMDDIVRPLWDYKVEVTGIKLKRKMITLEDIQKVEENE